jgi:hypothetical protein
MTIAEKIEKKKARLELYYTAEEQILGGAQSYTLGSRSLTRANLSEIKQMIDTLEDEIAELEGLKAGKRPRKAVAVIPRDF